MKALINFKTLLPSWLSSRVHLGVHSSKKEVQEMNVVERIIVQIKRKRE